MLLCAGGASNADIAADLCIELKTVERHLSHIYGKLHALNRTHAFAKALCYGEFSIIELVNIIDYIPPMARGRLAAD